MLRVAALRAYQTDGQTDRWTGGQTHRHTDRLTWMGEMSERTDVTQKKKDANIP